MRELNDWLDSYMLYMENTESAKIYHKWTSISVIAAVLRKKVRLSLGRIRIYPNLYIVLVGPPGGPRKSQAITFATEFLANIPDITYSADATTPQALVQDLEGSAVDEQMADGSTFRHASLTIISKEFESFLGAKTENTRMITYLTDLYDAQEVPWKYRTKHSGSNIIPSVFLNMQAATTPDSIANTLPTTAVGMGLTSRITYLWATDKYKPITAPVETPEDIDLREKLAKDLYVISRLVGEYKYDKKCFVEWDKWYQSYRALSPNRICQDPTFDAWYQRKPNTAQKISIVCAASRSNEFIIKTQDMERSLSLLEEAEAQMEHVFRAVGRSTIAVDVALVVNIVKAKKWITEKQLLSLVWRDIDSGKFDNVIATATKRGLVKRLYVGPNGEKGDIWYYYTGR